MQQMTGPDGQPLIYTVSQINDFISDVLSSTFRNLTLEGEISNWKPSPAGHIYFTLKDNQSQIRAVMFKGDTFGLRFRPKDGDKVRCTGSINVYKPQGTYQIIVKKMEMAGIGNILQMIEERKQKLAAEGLFNPEHKKTIPQFPKTVGVVTSPTGAAIRDILNVTKRRNPTVNITVLPSLVQGDGAAATIVKMIEIANFYKLCDVLIVGRGGGSLEDLLPFSEESVVRAVYNSEIPVISAVGHEIDWALCDYAADRRAPTPSAAAELAVPELSEITRNLMEYKNNLYTVMNQKIEKTRLMIKAFDPEAFQIRFKSIQQPLLQDFETAKENLYKKLMEKIKDLRTRIANNVTVLENASPETIFKRGYSMVRTEDGTIIRDSSQVSAGQKIEITPANGKINAQVL